MEYVPFAIRKTSIQSLIAIMDFIINALRKPEENKIYAPFVKYQEAYQVLRSIARIADRNTKY